MNRITFSSLLLIVIALTISYADSRDVGSYLSAILSQSPVTSRQTKPRDPIPPLSHTNSFHRSNRYNHHRDCRNDYKFDYLQLTLQWAPGYCATSPQQCKRSENRLFTIHGMWPQSYDKNAPDFCCFDNTFNYDLIEPLVPQLNKYWFSLFNDDSRGFWSHEWLKHGTCLRDVKQLQGEKAFFSNTLNMVNKLPVMETLAKSGIVPNDKTPYKSADVQNALKQLTGGKSAKIECDLEAHQNIPLLKGVDFCFDSDMKFIDCPRNNIRCKQQLLFLSR